MIHDTGELTELLASPFHILTSFVSVDHDKVIAWSVGHENVLATKVTNEKLLTLDDRNCSTKIQTNAGNMIM